YREPKRHGRQPARAPPARSAHLDSYAGANRFRFNGCNLSRHSRTRHPVKMKVQHSASGARGQVIDLRSALRLPLTASPGLFSLDCLTGLPRAKDQYMFRPIYLAVVLPGASGSALAQSDLMTIYQE